MRRESEYSRHFDGQGQPRNGPPRAAEPDGYDPGDIVWEAPRGEGQRIKLAVKSYQGKAFLDLRIEWRNDAGAWCPTRKGVSVRIGEADDLAKALGTALDRVVARERAKP